MSIENFIPSELLEKYEFYNYNHALEIITQAFPNEWSDIIYCLQAFEITIDELRESGGNETKIPKKIDSFLSPRGWNEIRIQGDLNIKFFPRKSNKKGRFSNDPCEEKIIEGYIDGHNIDYVKDRVACDLEWNSKD